MVEYNKKFQKFMEERIERQKKHRDFQQELSEEKNRIQRQYKKAREELLEINNSNKMIKALNTFEETLTKQHSIIFKTMLYDPLYNLSSLMKDLK